MLIEFRVKNFRSFRDEQMLSLVAGPDDSLPQNCTKAGTLRLLKSAGVYGANASGRSNLVKAVAAMKSMVRNSASPEPRDQVAIPPFHLDSRSLKEPSTFEVTFYHEGVRYQYGFSVYAAVVHEE
jgi:AAA15 family ATPase/GTPase